MPCQTDQPHFFFDHSQTDASHIYYSPDIDTGIGATVTPTVGQVLHGRVLVHNNGLAGPADVILYVCPPGTGISSPISSNQATGYNIAACVPASPGGSTPVAIDWTVPSGYQHFCLFTKVRDNNLGSPDQDYPAGFDPTNQFSAQCNVSIVAGGGRPSDSPNPAGAGGGQRQARWSTDFAFAVVSHLNEAAVTQVVAYPVAPNDEARLASLAKQPVIARALATGKFQAPTIAGVALGRERVIRPVAVTALRPVEIARRPGAPAAAEEAVAAHVPLFGHIGVVDRDVAAKLSTTAIKPEQTVNLVQGEVRQALVHITAPDNARPGDLFAVDIRHEVLKRTAIDKPRVLGGLIVILRIPTE